VEESYRHPKLQLDLPPPAAAAAHPAAHPVAANNQRHTEVSRRKSCSAYTCTNYTSRVTVDQGDISEEEED